MAPQAGVAGPPPVPVRLRSRRLRARLWLYFYRFTLSFFIITLAILLTGSAWALSEQALRTGGRRAWNLFSVVGAYVIMALISIAHVWSRSLTIKRLLRTMPKPYVPTKQMDLPMKVADHIMTEHSRTAVVAHISQATKGSQEGWGRPGTKWEDKHFRTYIISTVPTIRQMIAPHIPAHPHSLRGIVYAADTFDYGVGRLVASWAAMVDQARFSRREPTEYLAERVQDAVAIITVTFELKRARKAEEKAAAASSRATAVAVANSNSKRPQRGEG